MVSTSGTPNGAGNAPSDAQRVEKWAAIVGRWKFANGGGTYIGPAEQQRHGKALGSPRFRDGTIRTSIKLARNTDTAAGVFFGYQSLSAPYIVVELGASERAYAITAFEPGIGWILRDAAGSLTNLPIEDKHNLVVRVAGQTIEVSVNDVDVLRHTLPQPLEGTGFGLSAWGDAAVEFSDTTVAGVIPRVFVMMPFAEPFDTLYRDVILPVAKHAGFDVVRVDEIPGPGVILDDIQMQIEKSRAVVAEISTQNPNVFYELGHAHALRKPAVLLVRRQEGERMPFDIRGYRATFYDDSIGGKKTVEANLRQHLSAVLRDS